MNTTPREHARFLYLALNKGKWDGKQVAPAAHYEFAWAPSKANPTYGAQWWVYPRIKDGPKDLVQTASRTRIRHSSESVSCVLSR